RVVPATVAVNVTVELSQTGFLSATIIIDVFWAEMAFEKSVSRIATNKQKHFTCKETDILLHRSSR
ncbi:MAG TPA: hypothetical protein VK588_07405, partial [Chitinophagaceae bacterium]|nr:hypothetical protein [Chitinophagaceae bacterium]